MCSLGAHSSCVLLPSAVKLSNEILHGMWEVCYVYDVLDDTIITITGNTDLYLYFLCFIFLPSLHNCSHSNCPVAVIRFWRLSILRVVTTRCVYVCVNSTVSCTYITQCVQHYAYITICTLYYSVSYIAMCTLYYNNMSFIGCQVFEKVEVLAESSAGV